MKRAILVLTILAALVRLSLAISASPKLRFYDETEHLDIALSIVAGEGFVTPDGHYFARGPGYPLFCAAHIALFGYRVWPIRVTQALLGALVVPLTCLLARRVASPNAAFLAALYMAFDPYHVYFAKLLLVEEIYAPLLAAQLLLLARIQEKGGFDSTAALAALAALSTLLHPGHLALMGALVLVIPFLASGAPWSKRVALTAVYVGIAAGVMFPWVQRNVELSGRLIPVTAKLGKDLYESIGPGATGGPATQYVWPRGLPQGDELELDDALRKKCLRVLREEPGRVLGLVPSKFQRFWNIYPNYSESRSLPYRIVSAAAYVPLFLFGLIGVARLLRTRLRVGVLWLLFPLLLCGLHLVFVGSVRYRIPLHPLLSSLAAVGLDALLWRRGRRESS